MVLYLITNAGKAKLSVVGYLVPRIPDLSVFATIRGTSTLSGYVMLMQALGIINQTAVSPRQVSTHPIKCLGWLVCLICFVRLQLRP